MKKINERLRELRMSLGLTQIQSAEKVGVKQQNWARWESGEVLPSAEMIYQICDTHDESADWLLGLSPNRKYGVGTNDDKFCRSTKHIISELNDAAKEAADSITNLHRIIDKFRKTEGAE